MGTYIFLALRAGAASTHIASTADGSSANGWAGESAGPPLGSPSELVLMLLLLLDELLELLVPAVSSTVR